MNKSDRQSYDTPNQKEQIKDKKSRKLALVDYNSTTRERMTTSPNTNFRKNSKIGP